jgi:hypothetical protein
MGQDRWAHAPGDGARTEEGRQMFVLSMAAYISYVCVPWDKSVRSRSNRGNEAGNGRQITEEIDEVTPGSRIVKIGEPFRQ